MRGSFIGLEASAAQHAVDLHELIGADVPLFRKGTSSEWAGPCPKCGGTDRFFVRPTGKPGHGHNLPPGFCCRKCDWTGTAIDYVMYRDNVTFQVAIETLLRPGGFSAVSPEVAAERADALAMRIAQEESERAEHAREINVRLQAIAQSKELSERLTREYTVLSILAGRGIPQSAVEYFGLGLTTFANRPAIMIPWAATGPDGVRNVRAVQYRFLSPSQDRFADDSEGSRYNWHTGSCGRLFNADAVMYPQDDDIIVVEGALKAASLWGHGLTNVCALPTKTAWNTGCEASGDAWLRPFAKFRRVFFALDPDATTHAVCAARTLGNARVAVLPMKPDDFLIANGGDVDFLASLIYQGRTPSAVPA